MQNQHNKPVGWGERSLASAAVALLVAGCALTTPGPAALPPLAAQWRGPLPHDGNAAELAQWWSQFDDPTVPALIDSAQREHGSLAQAAARIVQARAQARAAGSALWPNVTGVASATRARVMEAEPFSPATTTAVGVDASWEIDLFGANRNLRRAAEARADGSAIAWHDARVSLAAEVVSTYVALRACESLVGVFVQDADSNRRTADLTRMKVEAGFEAPANGALTDASAAQSSNQRIAQQAECDVLVKSLVALTAIDEVALRAQLAARSAALPQPRAFAVTQVPANVLAQRPDLALLERTVAAASAEVGSAQADRYPRLTLAGSIAAASLHYGGATSSGSQWSIGPALSLPLFDAGRRAANVDAARARYDEAAAAYTQGARNAVREVEESLVRLDSAARREADAVRAARGFRTFFESAQSRWEIGVGSLLDLEDARRTALTANAALINVQRERVAAWISLYKAVGGGWDPAAADTANLPASGQR